MLPATVFRTVYRPFVPSQKGTKLLIQAAAVLPGKAGFQVYVTFWIQAFAILLPGMKALPGIMEQVRYEQTISLICCSPAWDTIDWVPVPFQMQSRQNELGKRRGGRRIDNAQKKSG